jgi:hypothetical protein
MSCIRMQLPAYMYDTVASLLLVAQCPAAVSLRWARHSLMEVETGQTCQIESVAQPCPEMGGMAAEATAPKRSRIEDGAPGRNRDPTKTGGSATSPMRLNLLAKSHKAVLRKQQRRNSHCMPVGPLERHRGIFLGFLFLSCPPPAARNAATSVDRLAGCLVLTFRLPSSRCARPCHFAMCCFCRDSALARQLSRGKPSWLHSPEGTGRR